ncbi:MAG: fibronectin type III-like domain-contianing protein, partial [Muribaculaceae bacterium]|nr:fibronectin type III-like domain-contianing protein [Muribaculaceae bacterium]
NVTLTFDKSSFAYYDPNTHMWTVEPGKFEILIGNASDNIIAKVPVDVKETITWSDAVR